MHNAADIYKMLYFKVMCLLGNEREKIVKLLKKIRNTLRQSWDGFHKFNRYNL